MTDRTCPFGDPYCPRQDGDACHYVDLPGSPAMTPPTPYAPVADAAAGRQALVSCVSDVSPQLAGGENDTAGFFGGGG
jgi:hypothetical protein